MSPQNIKTCWKKIIALEKSAEAEQQELDQEKGRRMEINKGKTVDIRLKTMETLSETQKQQSADIEENKT